MAEISSLAYVVLGAADLDAWAAFAGDIVGFHVTRPDDQQLVLRMDEHELRIAVERDPRDDLVAAGWTFDTPAELDQFVAATRAAGVDVCDGGDELCERRRVERVHVLDDPTGFQHELVVGPRIAPLSEPFRSKVITSSFVTGPLGVGHILPVATDYPSSVAFYREVLGLRISDYIREELLPGVVADATFFHTRTGRHHSLATAALPVGTKRLNHLMVQVASLDDVGLALDRCRAASVPLFMALGHHPNDQMTSFYLVTPSGFALELGTNGLVIDDANWDVRTYRQLSDWGHQIENLPA